MIIISFTFCRYCREFGFKSCTNKTMMCGVKRSSNQYIKVTSSNNKPRSKLEINWKNTKSQAKDKERREPHTQKNVCPVRSKLTYVGREIDLSNPLLMSFYREIQKGYKKLVSTSSQRTNPNFYHFLNLTNEQDTQWFSLTQHVYKYFPIQENFSREP